MGIEPTHSAWKADILPLNNTRVFNAFIFYHNQIVLSRYFVKKKIILSALSLDISGNIKYNI